MSDGAAVGLEVGVWCRILMSEEGAPHGVAIESEATGVKPGRVERPVPPITAMRTGSEWVLAVAGG